MTTLFTVGYQGHSIDSFLDLLQAHGVAQLLDVRQLPFSRKPDFSKKRLSAHLAEAGIAYAHLVALGTPKSMRDEIRRSGDYPAFFAAMETLVAGQPEALREALGLAQQQTCALLCFEADVHTCHRLTVAQALARLADGALEVVHL
jgi:uncharacterized protein (DUF488 family)